MIIVQHELGPPVKCDSHGPLHLNWRHLFKFIWPGVNIDGIQSTVEFLTTEEPRYHQYVY